jgi:hypothetical protein
MLTSATIPAIVSAAIVAASDNVPATIAAKPASKPRAPKAAKPVEAAPVAAPTTSIADERAAAAAAVSAFYTSGPSFPFKSASVKLSDINPNNAKAPSPRTAALVAAMLAYAGDNIKPNGEFVRGGFRVPATLINPSAKRGETLPAMPESGCLGNMLGRVVHHVSGPLGGKQARDGVYRIDFDAARIELQQLGDGTAKPALAVLNKLSPVAKPAKPAKAA